MPQFENIDGSRRHTLLRDLIKDRTLVRLVLSDADYESLTLITDIVDDNDNPCFQIDPPKGFIDVLSKSGTKSIRFEFHSIDHVTHRFESELMAFSEDSVTLAFPGIIRRHQQRNNFRVKAFTDSYATVRVADSEIRMDIDNISLGGVYCLCRNTMKRYFEESLMLKDMRLYLTIRNECFMVPIKRIEVRRIESQPKPKHFGVAFEFIKIDREAQKRLVQQIYELQRAFLQKRQKLAR